MTASERPHSCNAVFRYVKRNILTLNRSPNAENGPLSGTVFYFFLSSPMLSVRSVLSKEAHNECQKYDGLMTVPQLRNLREMTLGMILGGSNCLSRIGTAVSGNVTPRKNTERYARTLGKMEGV
jgi:hypothetical protein